MPKKQKNRKHAQIASKEQNSRRQKRIRTIIISAISVIVVAALSVSGWFYYDTQVKPYKQAAIRVNDVTFDMRYYINMLDLNYGKVPYSTLYDFSDYGDQEIEQYAGYVEQQIIDSEIIKQGSLALGVQIERDDIKSELKESGVPVTDERIDLLMTQRLVEKQVPSTQPQFQVQAMLLESESAAQEAVARLQAGEPFEQVADEVSKLPTSDIVSGSLSWVTAREADLAVGSTKFGDILRGTDAGVSSNPIYDDTVSKKFGYWVIKITEKKDATDAIAARIHIQGILVGSEQEADDVIKRLNTGEDINELAKQLSQVSYAEESGAELGWMTEGRVGGGFEVLFDLPQDSISMPISDNTTETLGGYWVFNVPEKDDNRELTSDQENMLGGDLFERCSAELEKDPNYNVERLITEEMRVFAINEAVLSQGKGSVFIRTSSLSEGEVGLSYFQQLEAYGNQKGNKWSITEGRLLQGLSLDGSTGVISGTPEVAGVSSLTIEVNNDIHLWTQDYVLRIHLPVSVTTTSLPDGQVGVDYLGMIEAIVDNISYKWSIISGSLPDGLTLSETTGQIYGKPTIAGMYSFTVQIDDGFGKATQTLSITITAETSSGD